MKKSILVWLLVFGSMLSCSAMNHAPVAYSAAQVRPLLAGNIDLEVVVDQVQLLLKQGYTLEQIIAYLQRISQPAGREPNQHLAQVVEKRNSLELVIWIMLLGAALYGVYVWSLPYVIERQERASMQAKGKMVAEVFEELGRGAHEVGENMRRRFQNAW